MSTEVDDKDDDDWLEAMSEDIVETSNINPIQVSLSEISDPQLPVDINEKNVHFNVPSEADEISPQTTNNKEYKVEDEKAIELDAGKMPKSDCRPRSRDTRQCQKHLQEIIVKHEVRNEELEQREGDLRKRLETLECTMPAAMVWNICKNAQGAPTSAVIGLMEKQLKGCEFENVATTPSKHWDERVRKIEAERKEALRRAEVARLLLTEKKEAMEDRQKRLEDAKKWNREINEKMKILSRDAAEMREALKMAHGDDNSCKTGDCGEIRCRDKWLEGLDSISSVGSTDLECFAKLQELAEAEICMRRQITELERREGAYMRTLQQADEMWSEMEGDSAVTVRELKDQLNLKANANQQLADHICQLEDELESLKKKNIISNDELMRFKDKEYKEVIVGLDDGEATVKDQSIIAIVKTTNTSANALPQMVNQESLAYPETVDVESDIFASVNVDAGVNAIPNVLNKSIEALPIVEQGDRALDPVTGLGIDAGVGDEENIPERWKDHDWEKGCPSDIVCGDHVDSSTGMEDGLPKVSSTKESNIQATTETVEKVIGDDKIEDMASVKTRHIHATGETKRVAAETIPENDQILLSREELHNWYNIVDSVQHLIAIKSVAGVKGPVTTEKILREPVIVSVEVGSSALTSSPEVSVSRISIADKTKDTLENIPEIGKKIESSVEMDKMARVDDPKISEKPVSTDVAGDIDIGTGTSNIANIPAAQVLIDMETEISDVIVDALIPQTFLAEKEPSVVDKEPIDVIEKIPHVQKSKSVVLSPENIKVESMDSTPVKDITELVLVDAAKSEPELEEKPTNVPDVFTEIPEKLEEITSVDTVVKLELPDSAEPPTVMSEFLPSQDAFKKMGSNVVAVKEAIIQAPLSFVTLRTPPASKMNVTQEIKIVSNGNDEVALAEKDVDEEVEESVITMKDVPKSGERMPQFTVQVSNSTDTEGFKQQAMIIDSNESPDLEDETSEAQEKAAKVDYEAEPELYESRSPPDMIAQSPSKLARDFIEGKINLVANRPSVEKPYSKTGKVESSEKRLLPKPGSLCICTPPAYPLVDWNAAVKAELKDLSASRVVTGEIQIKPLIPKTFNRGRPNKWMKGTISTEDRLCQGLGKSRRSTIWSRLSRDKSTLTSVCVNTQTDSKPLVRKKVTIDEMNRKDDCTCSGVCPITTDLVQQISKPPPTNVSELFDFEKFPTTTTCCREKTLISHDDEIHCVECGQPMTTEERSLLMDSNLLTATESQKKLITSLKKITKSITRQNQDFTCCQCKKSRKDESPGKSRHKRGNKKYSELDMCCPGPTKTSKRPPKSSKSKRKPETKDQSTMIYVSRDKVSKRKPKDIDIKSKVSSTNLETYCECEESINDGTSRENDSCDCLLKESVSRGSSCNCAGASIT